jgi:hypothetical protein
MDQWGLGLLEHPPAFVQRQALVLLFRCTASAFQCDLPPLRGLSREQILREYARFTANWAAAALHSGEDLSGLQERLYRNAYRLGRVLGWLLGVRSLREVLALGRILYGLLDIDFDSRDDGEITVRRCYFSDIYSPDVCRVMSAIDRGLMAGLAGTGDLGFTARITEGQPCCRGRFTLAASPPVARLEPEQTP